MKQFKGQSVIEVVLVFILMTLALWTWWTTPLAQLQTKLLHWDYFSHVIYVLVAVLFLLLGGRSLKSYGLSLANWRHSLKWGLIFAAALWPPSLLGWVFGWLEIGLPQHLASTLVFHIVFIGFGEEILFRGYFQSRINEEFDRPFNIGGLRFGVGLMIASLVFGFAHVLNPFNPLQGSFAFDWLSGLLSSLIGLFLGLLREKTGSILAPAIAHGLHNVFFLSIGGHGLLKFAAHGVGWVISWLLLFTKFAGTRTED